MSPAIGRTFDRQEQHSARAVVLIGHGLWARRYGRDPRILGRTILVNEVSHIVIDVLPPGFEFPPYVPTDLVVPVPERPSRSTGYIFGIARLSDGAQLSLARQELDGIARGLATAFPGANNGRGVNLVALREYASGQLRVSLLVLLGAAFLVLLIGCANVGNLVLASALSSDWPERSGSPGRPPGFCTESRRRTSPRFSRSCCCSGRLRSWRPTSPHVARRPSIPA